VYNYLAFRWKTSRQPSLYLWACVSFSFIKLLSRRLLTLFLANLDRTSQVPTPVPISSNPSAGLDLQTPSTGESEVEGELKEPSHLQQSSEEEDQVPPVLSARSTRSSTKTPAKASASKKSPVVRESSRPKTRITLGERASDNDSDKDSTTFPLPKTSPQRGRGKGSGKKDKGKKKAAPAPAPRPPSPVVPDPSPRPISLDDAKEFIPSFDAGQISHIETRLTEMRSVSFSRLDGLFSSLISSLFTSNSPPVLTV
jgi:hypothetical protein